MKQLLITIAALMLVGCSDHEAEANKLFTEASQLVKDADAITEPYSVEAFYKRKAALDLSEKIPAQYPQSSLSVGVSKGDFKIQSQSIDQIMEKMKIEISVHKAARNGNIVAVKQHLAGSMDVNAKDDGFGLTPLHFAAGKGHKEIVELLIAKGADVSAANNKIKYTPLHYATIHGHKEIVVFLITEGADVNAKNDDGKTPLNRAIESDEEDIINLLRKHGAKTGEELKAAGN